VIDDDELTDEDWAAAGLSSVDRNNGVSMEDVWPSLSRCGAAILAASRLSSRLLLD
jgi:hypothetical protein